ncbi:39S ribosomal protein L10, mitochondrial [Pyrgilauda ruficollis]|uniref:39S ribosomal protein L10, mitochondrial n=1 Tax=Pyrgilauda ruficollis TaxID=221976 RepID=UPI001B86A32E|nr:39S ribosomal protein L10, mitochondrial [Pyrgilauda ruficollis]
MAALGSGGARWRRAWLPALQLLRRGSKAVTRHWKAMHFQRQKLLALTEYLPPRPALPPRCLPRPGPRDSQEDGHVVSRWLRAVPVVPGCPGGSGLSRWFRAVPVVLEGLSRWFQGIPVVPGCPGGSGLSRWFRAVPVVPGVSQWFRGVPVAPGCPGVPVLTPGRAQVARPVLAQSKWRNLLPLFVCRNILLVSPEPRAREMLRVLKGVPQVNLLGACIDDTILSRQGVETLARLPPLEVCRGQTVAALSLPCSQTSSLLQQGPARLAALLDQHIRRLRGTGTAAGSH